MILRYLLLISFAVCGGLFYGNDPFDPFGECPDIEFKVICTDQCEEKTLECILNCESDNTSCISDCLREDTECIDNCPCEINCQEGCMDCPNTVCQCKDVKENDEWNRCRRANGEILTLCIYDCSDNKSCEDHCLSDYKIRQEDCPCEKNCPAGCPCDDFNCLKTTTSVFVSTSTAPVTTTTASTSTTTTSTTAPAAPNAVLVLSTRDSSNKPMVVTFDGVVNNNLDFEYEHGTEAVYGCGVTLKGQFWYLGGQSIRRQVSQIIGCKLVGQADMSFDFYDGSCNTFHEKVLMCFDRTTSSSTQECHIFDGVLFTSAASTNCYHYNGRLANYKGLALTTGSFSNTACYVKSELYNFETNQWTDAPNYPFTSFMIQYVVASIYNAAFLAGGYVDDNKETDIIAKFQDNRWTRYGSLKTARRNHGAITGGDETMIIGGYSESLNVLQTEVWNFNNGNNKLIQPTLPREYNSGIGLYLVDASFCKKQ